MNFNRLCMPGNFFLAFGIEETWPGITVLEKERWFSVTASLFRVRCLSC